MPPAVERLAKKYLRRPAIVTIGVAGQAVDTVDQRVEFVSGDDKKKARLIEILNSGGFEPPMIVFVNQKKGADVLMKDLVKARVSYCPIVPPPRSYFYSYSWKIRMNDSGM